MNSPQHIHALPKQRKTMVEHDVMPYVARADQYDSCRDEGIGVVFPYHVH
jgi:hypothetical protein